MVCEILTYNIEINGVAHGRRGGDLALVLAGVAALRAADAKRPLLGARLVLRLEALVRRVRVPPHRQQVDVAVAHPWHLIYNISD